MLHNKLFLPCATLYIFELQHIDVKNVGWLLILILLTLILFFDLSLTCFVHFNPVVETLIEVLFLGNILLFNVLENTFVCICIGVPSNFFEIFIVSKAVKCLCESTQFAEDFILIFLRSVSTCEAK